MKSIAVIGGGISGLAAAYFLSRRHRVHLFEKDARLGGHTNTVLVAGANGPVPLDTGFLVHNDRTYPNLFIDGSQKTHVDARNLTCARFSN